MAMVCVAGADVGFQEGSMRDALDPFQQADPGLKLA